MPEDDDCVLPFPDQQQAANTLQRFKPKHIPQKGQSSTYKKCLRELIKLEVPEFCLCWTMHGLHSFPGVA